MGYPVHIGHDNAGAPTFSPTAPSLIEENIPREDKTILRELAKQYARIAGEPVNQERIARIKRINRLTPDRPPVWIEEVPWHELNRNGELTLRCGSQAGKTLEQFFRRNLFQWNYFQTDMVAEDALYILKSYSNTGIGITVKDTTIPVSECEGSIASHHYEDQLDTFEKIERLVFPKVKAQPENDKRNLEICSDIFDGILPVKLRGHYVDYSPWEHMAEFRGVSPILEDMIADPELLHGAMKKLSELGTSFFDQFEAEGLLDSHIHKLHCTPGYTDALPAWDYDGGKTRFKDVWLRTRAQMFTMVSPSARYEFDLAYLRPFMDRCGLVYYGCCEPLDRCMPYLKQIPNMRKIGASPWANIESLSEQIGGDYVLARKPNPALVAMSLDEEALTKEITQTVESCLKNKCPYEIALKDISTVGGKPENLFKWAAITNKILDSYYT